MGFTENLTIAVCIVSGQVGSLAIPELMLISDIVVQWFQNQLAVLIHWSGIVLHNSNRIGPDSQMGIFGLVFPGYA